jgi:hypothetical protein
MENELQEITKHLFPIATNLESKAKNQQLEVKIKDE